MMNVMTTQLPFITLALWRKKLTCWYILKLLKLDESKKWNMAMENGNWSHYSWACQVRYITFGSVAFLCDEVERYYNVKDFNFCLWCNPCTSTNFIPKYF